MFKGNLAVYKADKAIDFDPLPMQLFVNLET